MATKLVAMIQTIAFIIIAVLVSIILLSYFNINMNSDETLKLNRFAIYEGYTKINNSDKLIIN
jgi:hypothetical protein